jgi:hypothetical protein
MNTPTLLLIKWIHVFQEVAAMALFLAVHMLIRRCVNSEILYSGAHFRLFLLIAT